MAKKQKKQSTTHHEASTPRIVNFFAFFALAAAAILLVIGPILGKFLNETGGGVVLQVLNIVAQYFLLAAIAIPAWYFVRGKRNGWKVFYCIVLVIYVVGTILGVTLGI